MKSRGLLLSLGLLTGIASAQTLNCNFQAYKPVDGMKAAANGNVLELTWQGETGQQLQAQFTIRDGQPIVQQLAARDGGGRWVILGRNLTPDDIPDDSNGEQPNDGEHPAPDAECGSRPLGLV